MDDGITSIICNNIKSELNNLRAKMKVFFWLKLFILHLWAKIYYKMQFYYYFFVVSTWCKMIIIYKCIFQLILKCHLYYNKVFAENKRKQEYNVALCDSPIALLMFKPAILSPLSCNNKKNKVISCHKIDFDF